jgi:2-methylcitrate dehydratase PrpD
VSADHASNSSAIARYVGDARSLSLPENVREAARMCLVDWMAVCLGARSEEAARTVRAVARKWQTPGRSTLLAGGRAGATAAALCNGTLAHCLDFDDTYVKANTHTSAPLWGATLALGQEVGATEDEMLTAFVVGFELAARIGYGLGEAVTARGFHATGVFGRLGAAAACAVLLRLDATAAGHALGLAATQASGLVGSFGTMSKPFHAGKAAMDGVLSAQLAAAGFEGATGLLEPGGALSKAIIQDGAATIVSADFSGWEILNNSFKPYAACHLTHPAIDAARSLALAPDELARVERVGARIGALAYQITGGKSGSPRTALEAKFDVRYCVALALHGRALSASDFVEPFRPDADVLATARKIEVLNSPAHGYSSAAVVAGFRDSEDCFAETLVAKGHPGNPMGWDDMRAKFDGLVGAGPLADRLFENLRRFGSSSGEALQAIEALAAEAEAAHADATRPGMHAPPREAMAG